jgi:hypothetical protein
MTPQDEYRWQQNLRQRSDLKSCCKHHWNLVLIEETTFGTALKACKVCGRRHRLLVAEPGFLGLASRA